jgi:hypothetical protein
MGLRGVSEDFDLVTDKEKVLECFEMVAVGGSAGAQRRLALAYGNGG